MQIPAFLPSSPFSVLNHHRAPPPPVSRRPYPCMSAKSKQKKGSLSPTIINRQARFRYEFVSTYECGVELVGTEVKSVRNGGLNIRDGYARVKDAELFLHNVNISHWSHATGIFNHDPIRTRKLLLHKKDILRLESKQKETGLTLIPVKAYFKNGYLKFEIALARGKKLHDKREDIKRRDAGREMQRIIKATM